MMWIFTDVDQNSISPCSGQLLRTESVFFNNCKTMGKKKEIKLEKSLIFIDLKENEIIFFLTKLLISVFKIKKSLMRSRFNICF